MSCSASVCHCGWCGTTGRGDVSKALARVRAKQEAEQRRLAEYALKRDLAKSEAPK